MADQTRKGERCIHEIRTFRNPIFFNEHKTSQIWQVTYHKRSRDFQNLKSFDAPKNAMLLIDEKILCIPSEELYVIIPEVFDFTDIVRSEEDFMEDVIDGY
jgi:hypothetical protein